MQMTQLTYRPTDPENDPDVTQTIAIIFALNYSCLSPTSYPIVNQVRLAYSQAQKPY